MIKFIHNHHTRSPFNPLILETIMQNPFRRAYAHGKYICSITIISSYIQINPPTKIVFDFGNEIFKGTIVKIDTF